MSKKLNGTVIVTYRCNARCSMCNRYKAPSLPEEELSIETIKKLPADHAGKYECSELEYLWPGTIKLDRLGESGDWFAETAKETSVELGKSIVCEKVETLIKMMANE